MQVARVTSPHNATKEECPSEPAVATQAPAAPAWAAPLREYTQRIKQRKLLARKEREERRATKEAEQRMRASSWVQATSRSGRTFYYNTYTGASARDQPRAMKAALERAAAAEQERAAAEKAAAEQAAQQAQAEFESFFGSTADPFADPFSCDVVHAEFDAHFGDSEGTFDFKPSEVEDALSVKISASACSELFRRAANMKWARTRTG